MQENLGKKGRDKVTGFEGIIIAHVKYLFGCDQYGLTARVGKGKEIRTTEYFDIGRIEIIGKGIPVKEVQTEKPGGVNRDRPRI